ncbi:MAG: coenzyme F420-0:L-glutamate ligase [Nitrososphaerota archaeon]|nr:coenzyme F420-0:L-glutamate ligase [Nitrososphaerota archaeon]
MWATDAGLDYSNNPQNTASLPPSDPNASATRVKNELERLTDLHLAVVLTNSEISFTNMYGSHEISIGYSGIRPVSHYFGSKDSLE